MLSVVPTENALERLHEYKGPAGAYDEFRAVTGEIRPHWQRVLNSFQKGGPQNLTDRWHIANRMLQENGVNFTGTDRDTEKRRPWKLDVMPLVFSAEGWATLRAGVTQRARLIDAIVQDLYSQQTILKQGLLPPELVYRNPEFQRSFYNLPVPNSPLLLYGCELARSVTGQWWVMADRASAPAGISYAVENRIVLSKTFPKFLHASQIHRLAPFFVQMQETLQQYSPQRKANPSIVIMTAGPEHPYYYEDIFLARYLGYPLVEADDLTIRRNQVWIKTLRGLMPVDVILRRMPDHRVDPLEICNYSPNGIAGLLQVMRHKGVVVANGPESGLLDSPAYMPFLPKLCQHFLNEDLKLPSIATWWCGQPEPLAYTMQHFEDLVIKPAFAHSGGEELIVSDLKEEKKQQLKQRVQAQPGAYIAQEKIVRSTSPCWIDNEFRAGHMALRTFAVRQGSDYTLMDGGLVRVETTSKPMPLSISAGEFSKDVWVCSEVPVPPVSLLGKLQESPSLQRSTSKLPSRVADNLFWFGRYLERLEFSGRMIRKVTERLMSESANQPVNDVAPLIGCLAEQGIIEESFAIKDFFPSRSEMEKLWPKMLWRQDDHSRFDGLCSMVSQIAAIIRDRMTEDFWRSISQIDSKVGPTYAGDLSELLRSINVLMLHISATTGQITDGLVHGPTRQFILIGRYLERARQLTFILKTFLEHVSERETLPIVTLLDVCNSLMTYRYRYRANFAILPAFDLLVTDSSNPHALIFQFQELHKLVSELPGKQRRPFISPELDLIRRILFELQSVLPTDAQNLTWQRFRQPLEKIFENLDAQTKQISDLLTQTYFHHAEFTQQMEDIREIRVL